MDTLREKQELERITQALYDENTRLKQQYNEGAEAYIKTASSAAELELENAKKKLKEAHEAFDPEAIVDAQEALEEAKFKLRQAKSIRVPSLQQQQAVVQPQQTQSAPQIDEKTLRWQAKNQWFGASGFEEITSYALGLHQKLVSSGVDPRSDEYFGRIDARMRELYPDFFGESRREARKPANVVAPASRSTKAKKVVLTSTQVALAKRLGVPLDVYAKQIAKEEAQNG